MSLRSLFAFFAALVLGLSIAGLARSEPATAVLGTNASAINLLAYTEVLEDPIRVLTLDDVASARLASSFHPLSRGSVGLSDSAFWLKFRLARAPDAPSRWVLALDYTPNAVLYVPGSQGHASRSDGMDMPFSHRDVEEPEIAFAVDVPVEPSGTWYMRVASDDVFRLDIVARPELAFGERASSAKLEGGLYYGAMLALIGFNAVIFAATRDRAVLFYALFELSWIATQASMDRTAFQYVWPEAPRWAFRSDQFFGFSSAAAAIVFSRRFLDLDVALPRARRPLAAAAIVGLVLAGVSAVNGVRVLHRLLIAVGSAYALACCVGLLAIGGVLACRRAPNARLFVGAWSVLALCVIVHALNAVGVFGLKNSLSVLKFGSVVEAMLLSLGLALRVDRIRRERDAAGARIARARDERLAALGRLIAGFAHEIGNPLNFAIGGAAEMSVQLDAAEASLRREPAGAAGLHPAIRSLAGVRRAARLVVEGNDRIKRLLDNLRCYAATRAVEPVPTDVVRAIESTIALATPLLERSGTRVTLQLAPIPFIDIRPGELEQVMTNLIVNACQAMGRGGEITIASTVAGGRACISVSDTGPGVPPSRREAIFEPFYTSGPASAERSGLGLYVSADIVARHGGELHVDQGDVGARFVVELPLP